MFRLLIKPTSGRTRITRKCSAHKCT